MARVSTQEIGFMWRTLDFLLPVDYRRIAQWSGNLGTALAAGVPVAKAIRTATRSSDPRRVAEWESVLDRVEQGEPLADALAETALGLPPFFVPLVSAGERAGRLDEAFQLLANQCQLMARPSAAMRNAWLAPLVIYLCATVLTGVVKLAAGHWSQLFAVAVDLVSQCGSLAAVLLLLLAPPLKPVWDQFRLWVPVWGRAERDLSVSRFLRVFAMHFATGGIRVEQMIRSAALAVDNDTLRREFVAAAQHVQRGADLVTAFASCPSLRREERDLLASGETTGTIDRACDLLARGLDEDVAASLRVVTAVTTRVTLALVVLSLMGALGGLVPALTARRLSHAAEPLYRSSIRYRCTSERRNSVAPLTANDASVRSPIAFVAIRANSRDARTTEVVPSSL